MLFSSQQASAQTPPYNWFPGRQAIDGCTVPIASYCISPEKTCVSKFSYPPYQPVTDVNLSLGTWGSLGTPAWICGFTTHAGTHLVEPVYSACPIGFSPDVRVPGGCSAKPVPKTQGNTACPPNNQPTGPQVGNPITVCSGNKFEKAIDFRSAGANVMEFVRYYNSQSRLNGVLGVSWQHNWERRLLVNSTTNITVVRPDGQELSFSKSGNNWVSPDADVTLKLAAAGSDYTLTLLDGTVETYNAGGKLQTILFKSGYLQTLTYASDQLTQVSDNQNRSLGFTYNADGFLETMTDPDGNIYEYGYARLYPNNIYTTVSKLISVTYPSATTSHPQITYHYENANFPVNLTGITDELNNRYATWGYDDATGQATVSEHAGGAGRVEINYDSDLERTATFPLGEQVKYTFQNIQGAPKIKREDRLATSSIPAANRVYTYDSNGFLASRTDWNGNKTTYVNNSRGLQTSRTEASTTALARTTTTTWHATLAVPTEIVAPRMTTTFTYDTNGNMETRTETDTTSQSVPYSTHGQTRTWTYTYNSLGQVLTATGPRTDVSATTAYTYDASGNLKTITDPLNHVTTIDTYNNRGLPTQMTDANGVVTTFTYNERGNLLTRTVDGTATTGFGYNAAQLVTSITLPDSSVLNYEYDNAHRLKAVYNNLNERIDYTLDAGGNITKREIKNPGGTLLMVQTRVFDEIGRLFKEIGASSQTTEYGYDSQGNRISIKNALNDTTTQAFDALNRLITVTDPLTHATGYGYDAQDNLTSVTDPRSLVTGYIYDGFGQVIQETSPDRGTTVYVLDKAGNRITETDARGVITNRSFDKLDRVLTETFPASAGENIAYSYDATAGGNKGIGRLTGFTDESGSTAMTYDARGNLTSSTRVIGGKTYTTEYDYDLADRVTRMDYPASTHLLLYEHDAVGRANKVTYYVSDPSGGGGIPLHSILANNVAYLPFGPLSSLAFNNSLVNSRSYDQDYRLTGLETSGSGANIQDLAIAYDGVNNITSITDHLDSARSQGFDYDELGRLVSATGSYGTLGYAYDANGNRLTRTQGATTQAYSYPGSSNRVSSVTNAPGTRSFTYTASGDIDGDDRGGDPDVTLAYNNRGRIAQSVTTGGATVTYLYNALGERVSKAVSGGATTHFHYDRQGHLIAETNGATGAVTREYAWLGDIPLASIGAHMAVSDIHPDHLNTPQKMTNTSRSLVWDRQQQPFGETESITGTGSLNLRFPGQYADAENATNYNMMRNYDPTIGRYIEADPIGLDGASIANMNLYGYANQNPITWYDPDGRVAQVIAPVILPNLVRAAALAGGILIAEILPFPPISKPQTNEDKVCNQEPDDCEKQVSADEQICRSLPKPSVRARCYESANSRYGACRAGKPLPPLITQ